MNKTNKNSGLTLVELVVAVGIFGLVVTVVFGVFGLALTSQRRIIALKNVEDNARFSIELMAREIRTGRNFSGGIGSLSFINAKSESVIYRLNSNVIEKSSDGGISFLPVTGPETIIDYLNFYLAGQAAGDGLQPRITITIGATSRINNQSANLKVQTTISGRFLQS
ncbi:MAG: prepilin-type N-terminal cleavage/methylation domain-containing protein [Candidatus Azambacteria bacterium]|nr:prepilin-type N-terminal cleavage/methylation domain-containing protein [Candidatus Azambacteria bacterium]